MRHTQTQDAFLPSAGYNYRRATRHTYVHSALVTVTNEAGPITGLGHFYRCAETGEIRRWGFDVTFAKDTGAN